MNESNKHVEALATAIIGILVDSGYVNGEADSGMRSLRVNRPFLDVARQAVLDAGIDVRDFGKTISAINAAIG